MEVSVISEFEMEEIQELGTRTKQRTHVSVFGLEGFLEIAKTKSRCISSKRRGAHFSSPKQKRLREFIDWPLEGARIFVIETKKDLKVEAMLERTNGAFPLLQAQTTIYS